MTWFLWTRRVAVLALLTGVVAAPSAFLGHPWQPAHPLGPVSLGLYLDVTSALLLAFVGLLVWVVTTYSLTNLRGRAGLAPAGRALLAALLGLMVMVSSASLVTVALGWTVSGLAVSLVVARTGTGAAPTAARTMRRHLVTGDLALWAAVVVGLTWLPSLDRARLGEVTGGEHVGVVGVVAALMVVACVTRSGLFPSHRWLAETAEAPSPVSALLHAGVVNGAGVLGVLAWPLFRASPPVLLGLLVLGAASVVIGAWAGRVRSDVKGRLACSTTSQMGYMCVQLGLGLPAMALMHLLGHGAYKSWMFLRAGGAIARNRDQPPVGRKPGRPHAPRVAAVAAAVVAALVGAAAARELVTTVGWVALVPVTLVVLSAAVAAHAAARLPRATAAQRVVVMVVAGIVAGLYGWVLVGWEEVLSPTLPRDAVWGPTSATALVAGVALAGVAVVVGARSLTRAPDSPLAIRLLPTALTPVRGRRRTASLPRCAGASGPGAPVRGPVARTAVLTAAATVGTAWPLRNMVAANPLARLESMPFDDAVETATKAHSLAGTAPVRGRAPLRYYLDLFDSGRIAAEHLQAALDEAAGTSADGVATGVGAPREAAGEVSASQLVSLTRSLVDEGTGFDTALDTGSVMRFCAALPPEVSRQVTDLVDAHASLWAQRAWPTTGSDAPGPAVQDGRDGRDTVGPWDRWRRGAGQSGYDAATGIRGAADWARTLPADPADAIEHLACRVELPADLLLGYLVATLASAPGWAAHAAWRSRRSGDLAPLLQLAALRMAHDVLFSGAVAPGQPRPELSLSSPDPAPVPEAELTAGTKNTAPMWQRALEIGVEEWLLTAVLGSGPAANPAANPAAKPAVNPAVDQPPSGTRADRPDTPSATRPAVTAGRPASQSLWCIDVRSERVRRHLEEGGEHRTYGYAGFFGAAVRYLDTDGVAHDQCPALIEPSFTARRQPTPLRFRQVLHRTATAVSATPLGALVVAEGGGILAALSSTSALLAPATARRFVRGWIGDPRADRAPLVTDLSVSEKVALAAAALRNTGLTENFAPLIVVCGHGSTTENNAYGTAYDCGACGGNDGRVNARLLVEALNDAQVRAQLAQQGLRLPPDTVAVAALHDTSTDEITLARPGDHPGLEAALAAAGRQAAIERGRLLPVSGRSGATASRPVGSRAADWSEPTPEWGLAGNAAIVFGPRELTAGTDLGSRVFLHGYDRHGDRDGSVIEQLLTAPLVVAQWINAQYYFSAVDPDTFGAGDKTTHNVVGDVGVLTGAHGDLRTGLPWQSLFRQPPGTGPLSQSLAHEPVRLLAVVDGDPDQIVGIVRRHETLTQLVGNEWIRLVCLHEGRAVTLRPDLTWRPWRAPAQTPVTPVPISVPARPGSSADPRLSERPTRLS